MAKSSASAEEEMNPETTTQRGRNSLEILPTAMPALSTSSIEQSLINAMPIIENCLRAMAGLKKADLDELHSYVRPPRVVRLVVYGLMAALGKRCTWVSAKRFLVRAGSSEVMGKLLNFDKDNISAKKARKMRKYAEHDEVINIARVGHACKAVVGLYSWTNAILQYHEINMTIQAQRRAQDNTDAAAAAEAAVFGTTTTNRRRRTYTIRQMIDARRRGANKLSKKGHRAWRY